MSKPTAPVPGRLSYDDGYETCERTVATLRIYGVEPAVVTNYLKVDPSVAHVGPQARSAWILSSDEHVSSKDLRRHLDWLLDMIVPGAAGLKALQAMEGVITNVTCVWWSAAGDGGPTLWPRQMRRLADPDLECSFEFAYYEDTPGAS
jgi:Domain of unknown function (DUF4279)